MKESNEGNSTSVYKKFIESFQYDINALRDYTKSVSPILDQKAGNSDAELLVKGIQVLNYLKKKPEFKERINSDVKLTGGLEAAEKLLQINNIKVDGNSYAISGPNRIEIKSKIDSYNLSISQKGILYQSTLINLVVFFEILIGKLIKQRLISYPKSGGIENKSLTLSEINSLGSIENALDYLIDSEVESVLRKKYEDWIEYFKKNMNVNVDALNQKNNMIVEITQRRNLFVHNKGIINNIYLKKVDPSFTVGLEIGNTIKITEDYLYQSLDLIEHIGIILAMEAWIAIDKKSEVRVELINDLAFNYLEGGRWELANDLYKLILKDKASTSQDKSIANINVWLCVKRLGKFDSIREEVVKADYSDRQSNIKLSYYALLNNKEKVFELLEEVLRNYDEEEVRMNILRWPVLAEYKEEPEYISISAKYVTVVSPSQESEDVAAPSEEDAASATQPI